MWCIIGATGCSDSNDCDVDVECSPVPKECIFEAKAYSTNHYVEADVVFAVGNDETRLSVHRNGTVEVDRQLVVDQDAPEDGHANLLLHKGNDASAFISLVRDGTEEGGAVATGEISLSSSLHWTPLKVFIFEPTMPTLPPCASIPMAVWPWARGRTAADEYHLDIGGNVLVEGEGQNAYLSVIRTQDFDDTEVRIRPRTDRVRSAPRKICLFNL